MIRHLQNIKKFGWTRVKNALSKKLVDQMKFELYQVDKKYLKIQNKNGLKNSAKNTYHHIPLLCKTSFSILKNIPIDKLLTKYFEGKYILNIMGAVRIKPNKVATSTQKIHRDIRSHTYSYPMTLVVICLLDDSTKDNGATIFMKESFKIKKKPSKKKFFKNSIIGTGKKGDLIIFDSNMWHCSGFNTTDKDRHILSIIYSKPFVKQALDYPAAFGQKFKKKLSPFLKQILGYNARVPKSLNEWYSIPSKRFYKSNQG